MNSETCRGAFSQTILERAKSDKDIIVVCTDSRGSASIGAFSTELPDQFVEMGIAEQNAVTVSSGMAAMGKKVFAIGPASFYSMRSAEQVKVDVAYSHNNVKIIGISGGISYGALGATHHSLQDITLMRAIPDLIVEIPSDSVQTKKLTDCMLKTEKPAYIRVGRGPVPTIYDESASVEIGKAIRWFSGSHLAIISCGQMVWRCLEASRLLKADGIDVTVYDMHTIKPLDTAAVDEAVRVCGAILTVEENSIHGGLGSAIAEYTSQHTPVPMSIRGIPDEVVPNGTDDEVFRYYHLDPSGIVQSAKELLMRK